MSIDRSDQQEGRRKSIIMISHPSLSRPIETHGIASLRTMAFVGLFPTKAFRQKGTRSVVGSGSLCIQQKPLQRRSYARNSSQARASNATCCAPALAAVPAAVPSLGEEDSDEFDEDELAAAAAAAEAEADEDDEDEGDEDGAPHEPLPNADLSLLMPNLEIQGSKCGFAALLGPSNSGKSTLLNLLVGSKVAIVTPKVQTTRCRVAGIVTVEETMVVYLDTPGVFKPTGRLDRAMVRVAWSAAGGADCVAIVLDAAQLYFGGRRARAEAEEAGEKPELLHIPEAVEEVFLRCPSERLQVCVCLNKMDTIPDENMDEFIERFETILQTKLGFSVDKLPPLFPMSAQNDAGVDSFRAWAADKMPAGPWLYPEDDLTDMPMRLLAAEVTREAAFMLLKHEVPYEIAIDTTSYKEQKDGSVRVTQDVIVNRSSQKMILTGKNGAMVKAIGMKSRKELAKLTDCTVHLMLTVKVKEKWKEDSQMYQAWGLDYNA
jgi:GTPase